MSKEKALVQKEPANLQIANLQQEFAGAVNVRSSLLKIPYLKLNNAMSDAVGGELGKVGEFACMTRGINYGPTVTIIPLVVFESASLLEKDTGAILCSSQDLVTNRDGVPCAQCPMGEYWNDWGTKKERKVPKCKAAINMIVVTPVNLSSEGRMMLSFRKTSHPAGRALLNLIASDPLKIPFGTKYTITSNSQYNAEKKKTYHVIDSAKIVKTPLNEEELQKVIPIARQTLEMKRAGRIVEDEEQGNDENTAF